MSEFETRISRQNPYLQTHAISLIMPGVVKGIVSNSNIFL